MLHVYALTPSTCTDLPAIPGIDSRPLDLIAVSDELRAVVTRHPQAAPAPTGDAVQQHELVVAALGDGVLPFRFGARYDDEASLIATVTSQAAELQAALDRIRGCVELSVRYVSDLHADAPAPAPDSGWPHQLAEHDRRRREAVHRAQTTARQVHARIARSADASVARAHATTGVVLTAAYLVPAGDVIRFTEALAAATADSGLRVLCTGPWPPYSFVSTDQEAA